MTTPEILLWSLFPHHPEMVACIQLLPNMVQDLDPNPVTQINDVKSCGKPHLWPPGVHPQLQSWF